MKPMLSYTKAIAIHTSDLVAYATPKGSNTRLDVLETLFAGLSVLIGGLTLIVGLLQLRWYWRRRAFSATSEVIEMEAALPRVSGNSELRST
jgi:hypothetical protein